MSRSKAYQRLLNDRRWKLLRAEVFRRANGLCELCKAEGFITPGVDVHHIKPVETGSTVQDMERLAYNPANCQLLCVACHIKVHQDMRTHTKEKVKENKERARRRFMEMNDPNYKPQNNDNTGTQRETTVDAHTEDRPLAGSDRPIPEPIRR